MSFVAEFYETLTPENLVSVYVLVSKEPLLIDRAQAAILSAAVPEALRGFNVDHLEGKGAKAEVILQTLETLPMMSDRRLVILRGADTITTSELAKLVDYLDKPNPSTVFVAICSKKVDKRIKFFQRAKKLKMLFELSAPKRIGGWIRDEAKRQQVQLSSAAANRLGEVIGSDLARLGLSLTQLSLYAGDREISVSDVDDLVADTRERSVFELTDAIAGRDEPKALRAVHALFEQRQSSIGVVMMLARNMRQLALCQSALSENLGQSELAKRVGVAPFMLDRLVRQSKHYSVRGLAKSMSLLAEADRSLKGFDLSSKVLGKDLADRVVIEKLASSLIHLGSR